MSHAELSPARFSQAESDELGSYHALSWLAVTALMLGLASCLVLLSVQLCIIPILGIIFAIAALRTLAVNQPRLIGHKAALCGLVLAAVFGAWGVTQEIGRQVVISGQARRHALHWLELVQTGRILEADQLHHAQDSRQPPETRLNVFYKQDSAARKRMEEFFQLPVLKKVAAVGPRGTLRYERDESLTSEQIAQMPVEYISQRFVLDYEEDGQPRSLPFLVTLTRRYIRATGEVRWDLRDVALPRPNQS
ncbi:MAG: DUF4190 domain-containing protein [Planctomycetota bacterium]|nr:DUF4190 domain-containing protein [Planctomycetota bacterium]